jgi:hypothetical protein
VCDPNLYNASTAEAESARVLEFLKETRGEPFNHEKPESYYGNLRTLDADTAELCAFCQSHDITKKSLELQLWWERHQKADAARVRAELAEKQVAADIDAAKAKLTPYELGLIKRRL